MKIIYRVSAVLLALILLAAILPSAAFATEDPAPTDPAETTASTAAPTVSLSSLYVIGSNNKNYLADPSISDTNNKYSFYVPDWMEEATLVLKSSSSIEVKSDSAEFTTGGGAYNGKFKLEGSKNTFKVTVKKGDVSRELTVVIYRSDIPCKLESVTIMQNSEAVKKFTDEPSKIEYSFTSGTTSGVSLRIVPRHEQTVEITNLTGIPEDQITGNETKTKISMHEDYKRYDYSLTLVEGTNVFLLTVTAGTVKKECNVTIIVGDPNANITTTTQSTESTQSTIQTLPPTETQPTVPTSATAPANDSTSGFPPVLWVTVGVVIAVVIGACVFMIVNMGNRNNNGGGNGGGYGGYDRPQQRYPARRNLADYVDDEYEYGYGVQPLRSNSRNRGNGGGGYYNSNSYDNYSDGYNPNFDNGGFGDGYDDGYGSGTPRGGSSSFGGFENDDDYGSGNYYGGY